MSKPKTHWRPDYPISYPSGPGTMRTFILGGHIVCPVGMGGRSDWSGVKKWVTCKNCLRIANMHRRDTEETIQKVLRRGDPLPATPEYLTATKEPKKPLRARKTNPARRGHKNS